MQSNEKRKSPKWYWIVTIFAVAILFAILFAPTGDDGQKKYSPEYGLATLDAGTYLDSTDIKVSRIKYLLENLASGFHESKDTIAEYTSKAQGQLKDNGINESCVGILQAMTRLDQPENTSYKSAITTYVLLRSK